MRIPHRD